MIHLDKIIHEVEQLPTHERWELVRHLLQLLQQDQLTPITSQDWHAFLQETYGILQDAPIQRWDAGDYEDRETLS
jgi:hypothetical protein